MKLAELDQTLALRPRLGSGVSDRAHALVDRDLSSLNAAELAFCLRQSIALEHVLPSALALVHSQPMLEAEYYSGDLLAAILHALPRLSLSQAQAAQLQVACRRILLDPDIDQELLRAPAMAFVQTGDDV